MLAEKICLGAIKHNTVYANKKRAIKMSIAVKPLFISILVETKVVPQIRTTANAKI